MKTFSRQPGEERVRQLACVICNSSDYVPFLQCNGFSFVKCNRCNMVYQNPQPVPEDLRKRYDDGYFEYEYENEENFFQLMLLGLKDIHFDLIESSLPSPRKFLDIGCATGKLLHHMKARGWEEQGVEICQPSVLYGIKQRNVKIFFGDLMEARFPEGLFQVVHCSHLIEHVTNPKDFFLEVKRILAPAGYFIITTPNIDGFQAKLFGSAWRSAIADHLFLFSRKTLMHLLNSTGFEVVRWKTWGGLAAGTAPVFLKKAADRLAKRIGFGDVMIFLLKCKDQLF
ncbi:MAG: class I SAM-dependent methyltransferase [Spirochaetota bacterium]